MDTVCLKIRFSFFFRNTSFWDFPKYYSLECGFLGQDFKMDKGSQMVLENLWIRISTWIGVPKWFLEHVPNSDDVYNHRYIYIYICLEHPFVNTYALIFIPQVLQLTHRHWLLATKVLHMVQGPFAGKGQSLLREDQSHKAGYNLGFGHQESTWGVVN